MQKFIRFGTSQQDQYDIIIHARNRPVRFATEGHNYPIELWLRLIELLKKHGFERIAAIGTKEQAFAPAGSLDFRGIAMEQLMNMMASTRMVIGPSSGPIHLASLCGTPHVVWARGRASARVDQRNKERYESYWNPLKTPVTVILHRNEEPPVDPARILACVLEMNARIHK
jgi:ADP-heptose:LPS heptosyltransferase